METWGKPAVERLAQREGRGLEPRCTAAVGPVRVHSCMHRCVIMPTQESSTAGSAWSSPRASASLSAHRALLIDPLASKGSLGLSMAAQGRPWMRLKFETGLLPCTSGAH